MFTSLAARAQNYTTISNLTFGTYLDTNGVSQNLQLDLYLPTNAPTPLPLVIYIFGGGWKQGSRSLNIPNATDYLNLCARGYALAAIEYRLSGVAQWPAQIHDVKGAVRWLRANAATYNLDPNRFGVWGGSSGAHLGNLLGVATVPSSTVGGTTVNMQGNIGGNLNFSDAVQAVCSYFDPADMLRMDSYFTSALTNHDIATSPESLLMGAPIQTVPELTSTASPLIYVKPTAPPFLLIHGTIDNTVPFNQSEIFNTALLAANVDVTFYPNYNASHGFPSTNWSTANITNAVYRFFDRTLKKITTNALPVAAMKISTNSGNAPLTVTFTATNSFDPDGTISLYAWSFGDDVGAGNNGVTNHTYTAPGIYTATLCVMDNQFGLRSITTNITVNQPVKAGTSPQVSLFAPGTNAVQLASGAVCLQANVTPGSSPVTNAYFYLNGNFVGSDLNPPYSLALGSLNPGHYVAACSVVDTNGHFGFSATNTFDVLPNNFTPLIVTNAGQKYYAMQFYRIPAATNFTYTVDASTDLVNWSNGATYTYGGNVLSNATAVEFSRTGTNLETIIVREATPMNAKPKNFLRARATVP